ncbi:class I SAM-dependent methyltransferase [Peptococcus simiae]|uniref:class I SAM-dependent methyltransferase n=1 Tax=Peptococcus simiae TaxID=1643805 RepID=UPI00397FDE03
MDILDACCGSRMFWWDKNRADVVFQDNRRLETTLCDGRPLNISPNQLGDFRCMDFPNNSFDLVVFDPPHLIYTGEKSWLAQKYGRLNKDTWKEDLQQGFSECLRVLKPTGTLIVKWNEEQISTTQLLKAFGQQPLFGDKRAKTRWLVFKKPEVQ